MVPSKFTPTHEFGPIIQKQHANKQTVLPQWINIFFWQKIL